MKTNRLPLGSVMLLLLLQACVAFSQPLYRNLGANFNVTGCTNNQAQLLLSCESGVNYVIESSPDLQNWTPLVTNNDSNILRSFVVDAPNDSGFYRVGRNALPLFQAAIAAVGNIDFKGNDLAADSFDSADTNYSTAGLYDPSKDKANGHIITDSSVTNSLSVANMFIKGAVRTGPTGAAILGPNGAVGDLDWINEGNPGIQPGHYANDMNVHWPDVLQPDTSLWLPVTALSTNINGLSYKYYLKSGNYIISDFTSGIYIDGIVNIYIPSTGRLQYSGQDQIYVNNGLTNAVPYNTSLHLYVGAASANVGGQGLMNATGNANNFTYFGLPGNTNFNVSINASFVGCIYCPRASFKLGGGGSSTYDFVGACVAKTVTFNGRWNFHFDENLERIGPWR